jgi:alkylation response protein AidB-like acyl-CoA dehydrogenase
MDFAFSEEQEELRRTVRAFLDDRSPESEVRRRMETADGHDRRLWAQLAQLGLLGLAIPDEWGGAGASLVEVGVVLEEAGRSLLVAPYFSTVVLATTALLAAGDEAARKAYLPAIAAGEITATLALTEDDGHPDPDAGRASARPDGDGWRLDGVKSFVLDGHTADVVVVAARAPSGLSLFTVPGDAPDLTRTPLDTMDLTRKQARLEFAGTPARLLGRAGGGADTLARVLDVAAVALAVEQVGGAARTLEMAVDYAKIRHQFGRPIGSFQAVKHTCADMLLEVEAARSAAYYGLWAAATQAPDLPATASLAKAYCSDAFADVTAKNIQVHGGIGFTWEHPAHLYFKRARASAVLFGDATYHRERLASRIGM